MPSCAVTRIVTTFAPTLSAIGPLAVPEVTATPFTVTVAVLSASDPQHIFIGDPDGPKLAMTFDQMTHCNANQYATIAVVSR